MNCVLFPCQDLPWWETMNWWYLHILYKYRRECPCDVLLMTHTYLQWELIFHLPDWHWGLPVLSARLSVCSERPFWLWLEASALWNEHPLLLSPPGYGQQCAYMNTKVHKHTHVCPVRTAFLLFARVILRKCSYGTNNNVHRLSYEVYNVPHRAKLG